MSPGQRATRLSSQPSTSGVSSRRRYELSGRQYKLLGSSWQKLGHIDFQVARMPITNHSSQMCLCDVRVSMFVVHRPNSEVVV